jgi:hypothetical protein
MNTKMTEGPSMNRFYMEQDSRGKWYKLHIVAGPDNDIKEKHVEVLGQRPFEAEAYIFNATYLSVEDAKEIALSEGSVAGDVIGLTMTWFVPLDESQPWVQDRLLFYAEELEKTLIGLWEGTWQVEDVLVVRDD